MKKDKTEIENKLEWSKKENLPKQWQWNLHGLFFPVSYILTLVGVMILNLSNVLMFDTHHLDIKVTPKK